MQVFLIALAVSTFTSNLCSRALDPLLPSLASELSRQITEVALFSSAFAFTFAIVQPPLGALGDMFGKTRLISICLAITAAASILGSLAQSYEVLLISRILAGMGAGGITPLAVSLVGDLYPMNQRQVALGRLIAGSSSGFFLGATLAGVIGEYLGWRSVLAAMAVLSLGCIGLMAWTFRHHKEARRSHISWQQLANNYRLILAHPIARLLLLIVMIEGTTIQGFFPYVAALIADQGQPRPSVAGLIIAGFPVGALIYSIFVRRMLDRLGTRGMMQIGVVLVASQMTVIGLGLPWQLYAPSLMLMGLGFFMMHGLIQTLITEVAPQARGTAVSFMAFSLFFGQAVGPPIYGFNLWLLGTAATMIISAAVILLAGLGGAALLFRQKLPGRAE